jgi:aerobic-type carbon monoxide dehydrogenase small subunit (CoxS/CutS family)
MELSRMKTVVHLRKKSLQREKYKIIIVNLWTKRGERLEAELVPIEVEVNKIIYKRIIRPSVTLLDFLREELGLRGTKKGCDSGQCGVCTILMDGKTINACLVLAIQADGKEILTIEGLSSGGRLHPLQEAFVEEGAVQCGFCVPGMILSAKALLDERKNPSEEEIREALSGNLCRCTGYVKIIKAVQKAAAMMRA